MSRRSKTYTAILKEVARGSERSPLFWWMVKHHDDLVAEATGKRMRWEPLCVRFAEHGLSDTRGRPATPRTARETWLQARRAVAEARRRKRQADASARPGQTPPSRMSPDWRPQLVPAPASASATSGLPQTYTPPRPGSGLVGPLSPPVPLDAPMEFPTVDADGNPLPEGKVFCRGKVRSRQAAEEIERMFRRMRTEDWGR